MKQSKLKKQPTRDDLVAKSEVIRDQKRIIKLTEKISHHDRAMGTTLMVTRGSRS
jgi:hypothetical protein